MKSIIIFVIKAAYGIIHKLGGASTFFILPPLARYKRAYVFFDFQHIFTKSCRVTPPPLLSCHAPPQSIGGSAKEAMAEKHGKFASQIISAFTRKYDKRGGGVIFVLSPIQFFCFLFFRRGFYLTRPVYILRKRR